MRMMKANVESSASRGPNRHGSRFFRVLPLAHLVAHRPY
ncbi:hypothetical protein DM82_2657 [Burkholderia oklahomensis]|uniref:Uncharacterized protein n=1 Tax=Burkholderia oklahomensis TaxID=342113 RepID=A0AAI8B494_9BURK|nr:hypothetical protein DM82_2657 [Burkholderia oklahomensis]AJX32960.1 hypothetical protein BG90_2077 [Burkholderia oklahomensis C6786]SUW57940.1 Uncharacterised protein [Burkholderia oklahomensis]